MTLVDIGAHYSSVRSLLSHDAAAALVGKEIRLADADVPANSMRDKLTGIDHPADLPRARLPAIGDLIDGEEVRGGIGLIRHLREPPIGEARLMAGVSSIPVPLGEPGAQLSRSERVRRRARGATRGAPASSCDHLEFVGRP